jgi:hypothetical protein
LAFIDGFLTGAFTGSVLCFIDKMTLSEDRRLYIESLVASLHIRHARQG